MGVVLGGNVGLLLLLLLIRVSSNYISTNQSKTTFHEVLLFLLTYSMYIVVYVLHYEMELAAS